MKSDVPEYQRISLAFFHGCFLTCLSSFPIIILTFLVWSDISVCPNIIKPHFSLKNQGGVEKNTVRFIIHKTNYSYKPEIGGSRSPPVGLQYMCYN